MLAPASGVGEGRCARSLPPGPADQSPPTTLEGGYQEVEPADSVPQTNGLSERSVAPPETTNVPEVG